ncbi:zinc finger BED domain-containing protein 5, partial [Nephila pilipes]
MNYENLNELSSDTQLEAKFRTDSLTIFLSDVFDEYPNLAKQVIRILLPFETTYLFEVGFSKYVATKTKNRNTLDAAPDMRVQFSNLMPNFKRIMESKKLGSASIGNKFWSSTTKMISVPQLWTVVTLQHQNCEISHYKRTKDLKTKLI